MIKTMRHRVTGSIPWYLWPLVPFVFVVSLFVMIPLGLLALLSIPYFALFPDRHIHVADIHGTPHQKSRVAHWRRLYRLINVFQRTSRAFRGWKRRG